MKARIRLVEFEYSYIAMQVLDMDESLTELDILFKGSSYEISPFVLTNISTEGVIGLNKKFNMFSGMRSYKDVLQAFQDWGESLANQEEPSDAELYKWAFEYIFCKKRECDCKECVFKGNSDECLVDKYCEIINKEKLLKLYKKAHTSTTFKWIDESKGIFEV